MDVSEQIERYLAGDLSAEETKALEQLAGRDPLVAQEVTLQRDIIGGLQEQRRLQLKARLDALPVPPAGWWASASTGMKAAVWSSGAALVLVGGMWLYSEATHTPAVPQPTVAETAPAPTLDNAPAEGNGAEHNAAAPERQPTTADEAPAAVPHTVPANVAEATAPASRTAEEQLPTTAVTPTQQIQEPTLPDPDAMAAAPASSLREADMKAETEIFAAERAGSLLARLKTEQLTDSRYDFHYRYDRDQLRLYGKFDASPYKLLELRSDRGSDLYLYYQNQYYALKDGTRRPTDLREVVVTDTNMVDRLEVLRTR
ncbi:hypothetical protein SAMN05421823_102290 [Catalinimonas alkaloidigena]|uniref:Zinc-finger domain-containing protein n=1 Tax=Catalinimonas alkaloidigena TaxID=1075417 RepID=A0A1G9AHM4_9BACT|nr:hypothetical protein [Catalinimonas alkaloidigena]SDK26324.1 hypothetical protein SAMN05421823_102290 [Catalinimonas alkaloidigena]